VHDSPEGYQTIWGHARQFKKVLIVHSPSSAISNSFKAEVSTVLMDCPTIDELEIFKHRMLRDMSREDFDEHIRICGASLRLLSYPIHEVRQTVDYGVELLVGENIRGLERIGDLSREGHSLIHLHPPVDESKNASPRLDFISQYVTDRVCTRFEENLSSQLLSFANCIDLHGTIRGSVFENRMYDFFLKAMPTEERAGAKLSFVATTLVVSGLFSSRCFVSFLFFRHVTIFKFYHIRINLIRSQCEENGVNRFILFYFIFFFSLSFRFCRIGGSPKGRKSPQI
jgi:hypothetical protein